MAKDDKTEKDTKENTLDLKSFTYASPEHKPYQRWIIRGIERLTGKIRLWRLYNEFQHDNSRSEETFWDAAIRKLEVTVNYDRAKLAEIPKTGPLVVVANHPYGVLDGVILNMLMGKVRDDYKVLTNSVLCKAEEAKGNLLEIDFNQTEEALKTNLATRKKAREVLKEGGCIAVFAAGGVSSIPTWKDKVAQDTEWQPFIAGLIQGSKATVVPLFFEGQNSRMFQFASLISPTLRLALCFKEMADKIGWTIRVRVGAPIPYSDLDGIGDRAALCHELRRRTYELGGMETLPPPKPAYRTDLPSKDKPKAY